MQVSVSNVVPPSKYANKIGATNIVAYRRAAAKGLDFGNRPLYLSAFRAFATAILEIAINIKRFHRNIPAIFIKHSFLWK